MGFITMVGFLTFGKSCDGLVLNNYAGTDMWMGLSRIAVAVSLVFSYPLAFTGCRDGFLDLAKIPVDKRSARTLNLVTVMLLGVITSAACKLRDVSFVLAFGGAFWVVILVVTLGNICLGCVNCLLDLSLPDPHSFPRRWKAYNKEYIHID